MKKQKLTRRAFLKNAAGTAVALTVPTIIPESAWGKGAVPPPSARVALGHIGVGNRGSGLLREFIRMGDVQYVAIADCFGSRRAEWSQFINNSYAERFDKGSYQGCAVTGDFRELLARNDIDAVVISTPDHWHVPIGLAAARAGKDMYMEKPMGLSVEQDLALREAVRRHRVIYQYGTQQRSSYYFRHVCELVRNGRVGRIHKVVAWCEGGAAGGSTDPIPVPQDLDYDMWLGPARARPYTKDRCTTFGSWHCGDNALGFIAGWGAHPLDIAQWGLDTDRTGPVHYAGSGIFSTEGLSDTATHWDVTCRYANGVQMRFMSANMAQPIVTEYQQWRDHGTTFFGEGGWLGVDRGGFQASAPAILKSVILPDELHLTRSIDQGRNFIDCVKSREEPISPIEAAVRSDTISQLSNIVIKTGRPLTWNPDEETIVGDETAARMLSFPMRAPWRLI